MILKHFILSDGSFCIKTNFNLYKVCQNDIKTQLNWVGLKKEQQSVNIQKNKIFFKFYKKYN